MMTSGSPSRKQNRTECGSWTRVPRNGGRLPMEMRKFGNTDMTVSVLGFGGAEIGFEKASPEVVDELLGGALTAGLNVIDTAECYPDSEELIGRAVSKRRKEFYLFTKC